MTSGQAPSPVTADTAARVAKAREDLHAHPFPRCFVCGPERDDGLLIFPGELGNGVIAGPWQPDDGLADDDGLVAAPLVWAALDCPSGWAAATLVRPGTVAVLGRLSTVVHARPEPVFPVVAVAVADGRQGRKLSARSALYTPSGRLLLAAASATWIIVAGADTVRAPTTGPSQHCSSPVKPSGHLFATTS